MGTTSVGRRGGAAQRLDTSARAKFFLLRFGPAPARRGWWHCPCPRAAGGAEHRSRARRYRAVAGWQQARHGCRAAGTADAGDQGCRRGHRIGANLGVAGNRLDRRLQGHRAAALLGGGRADTRVPARARPPAPSIRLLDTDAARRRPASSSRPAAHWQFAEDTAGNIAITPDGSTVIAPVTTNLRHPLRADLQIREFSGATGQGAARRWPLALHRRRRAGNDILWTSTSGSTLIVVAPTRARSGTCTPGAAWAVGVLTGISSPRCPGLSRTTPARSPGSCHGTRPARCPDAP